MNKGKETVFPFDPIKCHEILFRSSNEELILLNSRAIAIENASLAELKDIAKQVKYDLKGKDINSEIIQNKIKKAFKKHVTDKEKQVDSLEEINPRSAQGQMGLAKIWYGLLTKHPDSPMTQRCCYRSVTHGIYNKDQLKALQTKPSIKDYLVDLLAPMVKTTTELVAPEVPSDRTEDYNIRFANALTTACDSYVKAVGEKRDHKAQQQVERLQAYADQLRKDKIPLHSGNAYQLLRMLSEFGDGVLFENVLENLIINDLLAESRSDDVFSRIDSFNDVINHHKGKTRFADFSPDYFYIVSPPINIDWTKLKNSLLTGATNYSKQGDIKQEEYAKTLIHQLNKTDITPDKNGLINPNARSYLLIAYRNISQNYSSSRLATYCYFNAVSNGAFADTGLSMKGDVRNQVESIMQRSSMHVRVEVSNQQSKKTEKKKAKAAIPVAKDTQEFKIDGNALKKSILNGCIKYLKHTRFGVASLWTHTEQARVRTIKLMDNANSLNASTQGKQLFYLLKALSETGSNDLFNAVLQEAILNGALPPPSAAEINRLNLTTSKDMVRYQKLQLQRTSMGKTLDRESINLADNLNDAKLKNDYDFNTVNKPLQKLTLSEGPKIDWDALHQAMQKSVENYLKQTDISPKMSNYANRIQNILNQFQIDAKTGWSAKQSSELLGILTDVVTKNPNSRLTQYCSFYAVSNGVFADHSFANMIKSNTNVSSVFTSDIMDKISDELTDSQREHFEAFKIPVAITIEKPSTVTPPLSLEAEKKTPQKLANAILTGCRNYRAKVSFGALSMRGEKEELRVAKIENQTKYLLNNNSEPKKFEILLKALSETSSVRLYEYVMRAVITQGAQPLPTDPSITKMDDIVKYHQQAMSGYADTEKITAKLDDIHYDESLNLRP